MNRRWIPALVLLLAAVAAVSTGCGRPAAAPEPPPPPPPVVVVPVVTAPVETPGPVEPEPVAEVAVPAPEPDPLPEEPEPAPEPAFEPGLNAGNIQSIADGISYDEVVRRFGFPGLTISSNGADKFIVQWSDDLGVSFWGKFEDDRLVRKTASTPPETADTEDGPTLTHALYNNVSEGMRFEEVLAELAMNATTLSETGDTDIYRWEDDRGSSFTARFENGQLARKSGLTIIPLPEENPEEAPADAPADLDLEDPLLADGGEELFTEGEVEDARPPARRARPRDDIGQLAENVAESVAGNNITSIAAPPPRVRVVGSTRRQREADAGERRPQLHKAELPDFTYSIRDGSYEVRIHNDSEARVAVGLRNDKRGRDLTIEPHGRKSLHVDRGAYTLHYIYNDDPYTVYNSQGISVGGTFVSDIEVVLFNEQYDVRKLVRGGPSGY